MLGPASAVLVLGHPPAEHLRGAALGDAVTSGGGKQRAILVGGDEDGNHLRVGQRLRDSQKGRQEDRGQEVWAHGPAHTTPKGVGGPS